MSIKVPREVFEGLEEIRTLGIVNMLDWHAVRHFAKFYGYYEAAIWLKDNRTLYMRGVLDEGIEPEEGS